MAKIAIKILNVIVTDKFIYTVLYCIQNVIMFVVSNNDLTFSQPYTNNITIPSLSFCVVDTS